MAHLPVASWQLEFEFMANPSVLIWTEDADNEVFPCCATNCHHLSRETKSNQSQEPKETAILPSPDDMLKCQMAFAQIITINKYSLMDLRGLFTRSTHKNK